MEPAISPKVIAAICVILAVTGWFALASITPPTEAEVASARAAKKTAAVLCKC
jgi:hypothetical protein